MPLSNRDMEECLALDKWLCEDSLHYFVTQAFPILEPKRIFFDGWHIEAICEHLEACLSGEIRELLINMPPRHMKSLLVSVCFPAWVWCRAPEKRFLSASYAKSLSIRDSVKTRRLIQSSWYQERWGDKFFLTGDQNAKERFENNATGYRIATSVGGTGTGEGGDFISVDDPHKVREAESKIQREGVLAWWDDEMSSRENDPRTGCKIITMQRIHEADLSGHVITQGGYTHLMLPARYEPERKCVTSIGWKDPRSKTGELLWKERFDEKSLTKIETRMGVKTTAGQLQQRPAPADGIIFKRAWLGQFYKESPAEIAAKMEFLALSIDLPFDEGGTYAVFQVWGRKGSNKYLLDQTRGQVGFVEQQTMFSTMVAKWPSLSVKWIEKKANGAAIISALKEKYSGLVPILPQGSKEVRAEAVAPEFESGNVWLPLPEYAPWVHDFIEEMIVFNNGLYNDQVDACTQALNRLKSQDFMDWAPISLQKVSTWNG